MMGSWKSFTSCSGTRLPAMRPLVATLHNFPVLPQRCFATDEPAPRLLGFAGRLAGESPQTCFCETSTSRNRVQAMLRRLEVVAVGLPLFGGAQLAVDTTTVSTLQANGEPRRANVDGVALGRSAARSGGTQSWLVAVVVPVSWCLQWGVVADGHETPDVPQFSGPALKHIQFLPCCAKRVEQGWRLRWSSLLSCTVAKAVASSLLELPGARGADGLCHASHEVERDFRHAGPGSVCWRLNSDVTRPFFFLFSLSFTQKMAFINREGEKEFQTKEERERVPNKERERVPQKERECTFLVIPVVYGVDTMCFLPSAFFFKC